MVYRNDAQLLEIYETARDTLLHLESEGPISFSHPLDNEWIKKCIQGKLDHRRASLRGWKKPTPKDLEEISSLEEKLASLEEELAMVDRDDGIDKVLNDIGFSYRLVGSGSGSVACYAKELGDIMGMLTDHDIVSGEQTPCFYQVDSSDFEHFQGLVRQCELSEPKLKVGSALCYGGSIGGILGGSGGMVGVVMCGLVTGDFMVLPVAFSVMAGSLSLAMYWAKKDREGYLEEKAMFESYPQERREYFESIQLASGIDALTLATTLPYGVEERVQMRVEDVEDSQDVVEIEENEVSESDRMKV